MRPDRRAVSRWYPPRVVVGASLALTLLAARASGALSQSSGPWELETRLGVTFPLSELGTLAPLDGGDRVRFGQGDPALAAALSLRGAAPSIPGSVRATLFRTRPAAVDARLDCNPAGGGCLDILVPVDAGLRATGILLEWVTPPGTVGSLRALRPYGVAGAGLRRHAFRWRPSGSGWTAVPAGSHASTNLVLQLGIGFEVDAGPTSLRVEAGDQVAWLGGDSPLGARPRPGDPSAIAPGRAPKHDLTVTVGWSVPLP